MTSSTLTPSPLISLDPLFEEVLYELDFDQSKSRDLVKVLKKQLFSEEDKHKFDLTAGYLQLYEFRPSEALEPCLKATKFFEANANMLWILRGTWLLGYLYRMLGDRASALKYFEQLRHLSVEYKEHFYEAKALEEIAWFYGKLEYFEEAKSIFLRLGKGVQLAACLSAYAVRLAEKGDFGKALETALEAVALAQAESSFVWQAICHSRVALVYAKQNQQSKALEHLEQFKAFQDRSTAELEGQALIREATVLIYLNEYEKTIKVCLKAQKTVTPKGLRLAGYKFLSESYAALENYKEAYLHQVNFDAVKEEMYSEQNRLRTKTLEVIHETNLAKQVAKLQQEKADVLAASVKELEALNKQIKELSLKDSLTGLFNRRHLTAELSFLLETANRYGRNLSVVLIDVDHFKSVNDTFGHGVGDEVLKVISEVFREVPRKSDFAARYGGEEFCLVLTETSAHQARHLCERLRQEVENYSWNNLAPDLAVTISLGISDKSKQVTVEDILNDADKVLYKAKQEGRNCIRVSNF